MKLHVGNRFFSSTAFIDLLFNIIVGVAFLFMIAFLLINPVSKKNDVESKADYLIILTWDNKSHDDIDLWMRDPVGKIMSFKSKDVGFMHLDRDDLGNRNDTIQTPLGPVVHPENKEIVTLRGFVQGEYIVNVHMYRRTDGLATTEVIVQLDKVNPLFKTIVIKRVKLGLSGDEKTAFRFKLDKDGEVVEVNELPAKLTKGATR